MSRYDSPDTVFYLDPPYWNTAGYGSEFTFENYVKMAEIASNCAGKMVISINDHPDIKQVFAGLVLESVPITYTVGGNAKAAERRELIICSK
jgi:DNA adenine methylase